MKNRQPDIQHKCFGLLMDVNDLRDNVKKLHDSRLLEHLDKMSKLVVEFIYQYADGVVETGHEHKNSR